MNFKKQAEKLERFLDDEFKSKIPLIVLPDKSLIYKRFKIKQGKLGGWDLHHISGDKIDHFNLKATAVLAAKHYYCNQFQVYNKIKHLDTGYWTNSIDTTVFKKRYLEAKTLEKQDIYLSRWELTRLRSENYKNEIASMFKNSF